MKKYLFLLFLLLILGSGVKAQDTIPPADTLDYYEMSLEQLLNIKAHGVSSELEKFINTLISVASKKPLSTRESPSIVTLITAEEIKKSGARDLVDVLRLVPGIDFGMDVEGVVGIGTRGNWAHEGKVLLLIDGQEMNESLFATTQFGNHYPIEQIKKIEIIRGPGSAIYGGFAEYGVINIITKTGEDLNGISLSGIYGQMKDDFGRANISAAGGTKFNDGMFSVAAFTGRANRSDRDFTDIYGTEYNMAGNSDLNPTHLNVGASYKGLSFRGIADHYQTSTKVKYDTVGPATFKETFSTYLGELKYTWKINGDLILIPRFNYKRQEPWKTEAAEGIEEYHKTTDKYTGNLTASYNLTRRINIVAGTEIFSDNAEDKVEDSYFSNGSQRVSYFNYAFFTQGLVKHRIVNVILGARYDNHSAYGPAFVPRLGLTKKVKRAHFKLLYSNSFRAPSIENINLEGDNGIKPEKTSVIELEAGYQVTRKSIITANFFDITTKEPIVYYVTDDEEDAYRNFGGSGTRGVEVEYRHKDKWGYVTLNYSYYNVAGKEKIEDYIVEDNEEVLLAFPAHKVNLNSSFNITSRLSINPSASFMSSRYAYTSTDSLDNSIAEELNPIILANVYLHYSDLFFKGFDAGVGVFDILDKGITFIQPYNGYHAPLPGPSRELVLRLTYNFNRAER